ncbi:hypothetical protein MCEMIH22_00941 [Candidatus Methylacidiphilaceae bacterium]
MNIAPDHENASSFQILLFGIAKTLSRLLKNRQTYDIQMVTKVFCIASVGVCVG